MRIRRDTCLLLRLLTMALLVLARGSSPSLAEEPTSVELDPIVVDAEEKEEPALVERSFETPEDVTGFGEVIFAEPSWRSFETTAELLGESVGAQIRRQGGRDDFSTLSIRGAPAAQLRILLDGVALGRASDSTVNLADLPMDLVERIEVYRGFSPVALSAASSAGVVNVITRDPGHATTTAAIGGGSFGSMKMNGSGAGPLLGGSAAAFASVRHSDGDFDVAFDRADENPDDEDTFRRRNNDSDTVENLVRWRGEPFPIGRLQLRNHVFYKDEGVPQDLSDRSSKARLETIREIVAAGVGSKDGRVSAEQIVTWEQKKLGDSTAFDALDNTSDTKASTTVARGTHPLGKANWLSGSADYTWEGFDQRFETTMLRPEAERSSFAIAAGDDWTIERLDTTVSMQLRHHQIWNTSNSAVARDGNDHSTDPRLGLRWQALEGLAIKSNASTYFRPPSFDELYGTDGFTIGNPGLVPETGLAWDAGLEWTWSRESFGEWAASYSYFGSNIDDIILVQRNFRREARAENVSEATIRGHELRLDWQGIAGFALSANYTHQAAKDDSDNFGRHGKDLPGVPSDEGWVRFSWSHDWLVLAYDLEVVGEHFLDAESVRSVPTRTTHGVSMILGPFWKGLRLTLEGSNLGDSLVPDVLGYPLPGRAFFALLSWSGSAKEVPGAN